MGLDLDKEAVLERLMATTRCGDVDEMHMAAAELLAVHREIGPPVAAALGLPYPAGAAEVALTWLALLRR
jgi:hypothetical protein